MHTLVHDGDAKSFAMERPFVLIDVRTFQSGVAAVMREFANLNADGGAHILRAYFRLLASRSAW